MLREFTLDESGETMKILEIETRICPSCQEEFIPGGLRQLYCRDRGDRCRFDFNNLAKKLRGATPG